MSSSHPLERPIALLSPLYPPDRGGVAGAIARLAAGLSLHMPVEVLVPSTSLAPGRVVEEPAGRLNVIRFGVASLDEAQPGWFELLNSRGPYRLIHAAAPGLAGFAATYAARCLDLPCVLSARGDELTQSAFNPAQQAGLLHALTHADALVGASNALLNQAQALGALGRLACIPSGVDSRLFRPVPKDGDLAAALNLVDAFPVIGFFGEARQDKGLPVLLEAFQQLLGEFTRARLLMVGGIAPADRAYFNEFKERHPDVAEFITEAGHVWPPALPNYYALMDVLWQPATRPGASSAVLEALASGRLAIASRLDGLTDILDTEELPGLLVPPQDAGALVEATRNLAADNERWAAMEAKARDYALAHFSPQGEVAAYRALYDALAPIES